MKTVLKISLQLILITTILYCICSSTVYSQSTVTNGYTITLTANPTTILSGGDTSEITAQIYNNGVPLQTPGLQVHFESLDTSIATFQSPVADTNAYGVAIQTLTSLNSYGQVPIRAYIDVGTSQNPTGNAVVTVVLWGGITGYVVDTNGNGVPNATVTLTKEATTELVSNPENPQLSRSTPNLMGQYTFNRIPYGFYDINVQETDSNGNTNYGTTYVNIISSETSRNDIIIGKGPYLNLTPPGSIIKVTITPTPSPSPTQNPTPTLIPTPTPTPTPAGQNWLILSAIALGVAFLMIKRK